MTRSVEDKSTVRIFYESRIIKLAIESGATDLLDDEFDDITEYQEESYRDRLKSKWARMEAIVGSENRIKELASDIVNHYETRETIIYGKAMVVVMSRRIAVDLYNEIVKLRPHWHNKDDREGKIKVVMTGSASDRSEWQQHVRNKKGREDLAKRMKDVNDPLKIVIVRDMWLTGFDVPSMDTMYIDKPMKGHNLMQAIARVNRVFKDKKGGLIVDYLGIADFLKKALSQYTETDRDTAGIDINQVLLIFKEKYEIVCGMLHKLDYSLFIKGTPAERMKTIVSGMNFVMGLGSVREKDYLKTVMELEKAQSLCATADEAKKLSLEIGYFKAIKANIMKIRQENIFRKTGKTKEDIEAAVNQLVSKSIISEEVIDAYSGPNLPLIPEHACHLFRRKAATHSG